MTNQKALTPFSCKYSPQVPELLYRLQCSIAISTYQAGKLVFLSPKDEDYLVQLPRTFAKPMGIAFDVERDKMALACKDEIVVFTNSTSLAQYYPPSPNTYDALYMPRITYHTGPLDIHDLYFGGNGDLYAVNTLFSCIVKVDDDYNFTPYWTPPFIDKMVSEDRCHLNGMAMQNGLPKYASAFNQGNTYQSWREVVTTDGVIFDVETNEPVIENLPMPHSPRLFDNQLFVLLSATGELAKINIKKGTYDVVTNLGGFVRGMSLYQDYLFIGLSKLRKNSSTFAKLDIARKATQAGIAIVHLPTGSLVGQITYMTSVDEIYDVHIIPNKIRPNILNKMNDKYKQGLSIPETTFWAREKPKDL